jgi:sialate O-acetylesterase
MHMKPVRFFRIFFCLLVGSGSPLPANVKMPAIFGDHMVLQQDIKIPVWGTADPGEAVTVALGSETAQATAAADGSWRVDLPPLPTGTAPVTMTVAGKNTLTFQDVLVGEVWICGGQSNMQFPLREDYTAADAMAKADPQIRYIYVGLKNALDPQTDIAGGKWTVCTPQTAGRCCAAGYFFARELRTKYPRPFGLIDSNAGGTRIQEWTSIDAQRKVPELKHNADDYDALKAAYPQASAEYPAKLAAYKDALAKWQQEVGTTYNPLLATWKAQADQAQKAGLPLPPKPQPSSPMPAEPVPPEGKAGVTPAGLFNGMIAPLIPYAIKGALWYQGESNAGTSLVEYRAALQALIADWRQRWGEGDFPFLIVQLASYKASAWPIIREGQLETARTVPNTGLAVAIDIGDPGGPIHPIDKLDVGLRLARAAEHVAYGENNVYSGPIYDSMKVEGGTIRLSFTQVGSGLVIGSAPWVAPDQKPLPADKLRGFAIAGADKKWFAGDATIDGDTVVVSSSQVPQPVAVRYAWANAPKCNLYNKEGLPASPFRTDDWTDVRYGGDFLPEK